MSGLYTCISECIACKTQNENSNVNDNIFQQPTEICKFKVMAKIRCPFKTEILITKLNCKSNVLLLPYLLCLYYTRKLQEK